MSFVNNLYTYIPTGWETFFNEEMYKDLLHTESILTKSNGKLFPEIPNIFTSFYTLKPQDIKVVIFGKAPRTDYSNGVSSDMGLAFSLNKYEALNKPIKNIFTNLKNTYPNFVKPNNGYLLGWVRQGVFLINQALTLNINDPSNPHIKQWQWFIVKLIRFITKINTNCIYVMMAGGKCSSTIEKEIGGKGILIVSISPISYKFVEPEYKIFSLINDELVKIKSDPIDWTVIN